MTSSQTYIVQSLPLKEVLDDLAEKLQVELHTDGEEYYLDLPEKVGSGQIRGINFKSGLGIILYDCTFLNNTEIKFTVPQIHPAKFLYLNEGQLKHWFENNSDEEHLLEKFESAMVASKSTTGHVLGFKANTHVQICSLEIDRKRFKSYITLHESDNLNSEAQDMLNDVAAQKQFYYQGKYSLMASESIDALKNCGYSGIMRKLFLEGISYQLLTHLMAQYQDDRLGKESQELIRKSDMRKIGQLVEEIKDNPEAYESVKELASQIGTNENLLQAGIKHLTGYTTNQYIKHARLEKARDLLINTELSVSEIVYKIGLTNRGYFARLFKEKFKVTPRAYRHSFNDEHALPKE